MKKIRRHCSPVALLLLFYVSAPSQELRVEPHNSTDVTPDSRFQLIQSSLTVKNTFRLDRYFGILCVLTANAKGELSWSAILRLTHDIASPAYPNKVNFQAFTSGLAVRYTYLMNVNTG